MSKNKNLADRNTIKRQLENRYRENGYARRENGHAIAGEDGVTHINIAMAGKTELGVMLGFDFRAPFELRGLGSFLTLEGFSQYTQMQDDCPVFRNLDMYEARRMSKNFKRRDHVPNYNVIIIDAMYQRIKQFSELCQMVKESVLPFDMYVERDGERQRLQFAHWVVAGLEYIRDVLKANEEPNFWNFLRHNRSDWNGALTQGNSIAAQMSKRLDRKAQIQFVKHCISQRFPQVLDPNARDPQPVSMFVRQAKPKNKKEQTKKPATPVNLARRRLVPVISQAYSDILVDEVRFRSRSNLLAPELTVKSRAVKFVKVDKKLTADLPLLKMMKASPLVAESGFVRDLFKLKPGFQIPSVPLTRHMEEGDPLDQYARYDHVNNALIVSIDRTQVDVFPLELNTTFESPTNPTIHVEINLDNQDSNERTGLAAKDLGLADDCKINVYSFVRTLHEVRKSSGYDDKEYADADTMTLFQFTIDGNALVSLELHGIEVHAFGLFKSDGVKAPQQKTPKVETKVDIAEANPTGAPEPEGLPLEVQPINEAGCGIAVEALVDAQAVDTTAPAAEEPAVQ